MKKSDFLTWKNPIFYDEKIRFFKMKKSDFCRWKNPIFVDEKSPIF